jgi:Flp pilus assembly protein TadD
MFAAKKKPASRRFQWNLGLVPSTLLFALIFGSGYGYYVWVQIQPPKQFVAQRTAPPLPPPAAAPNPIVRTTPALVPYIQPQEKSAPAPTAKPLTTARNDDFDAPRIPSKSSRPYTRPSSTGVSVQRKVATDTITPALLDAYQAYQRGDYVSATQGYREVLSKDSRNRDALLGLAAIAQQQGQDETAQHYYRQLLLLDPRDPVAQSAMMAFSTDGGNRESRLKALLAEQPRSATLHFALGNFYSEQSAWGDAQQYYFNAHTIEPSNAQFTFNLAVALDHLAQRKLAAQFYQQALQLDVSSNSGFDHAQAQQRLNELTPAH